MEEEKKKSFDKRKNISEKSDSADKKEFPEVAFLDKDSYDEDLDFSQVSDLSLSINTFKTKLRNGCCKDCMKAFSKSSKVIISSSSIAFILYFGLFKLNLELFMPSTSSSEKIYTASKRVQILRM